jgi:hypothetical protein
MLYALLKSEVDPLTQDSADEGKTVTRDIYAHFSVTEKCITFRENPRFVNNRRKKKENDDGCGILFILIGRRDAL